MTRLLAIILRFEVAKKIRWMRLQFSSLCRQIYRVPSIRESQEKRSVPWGQGKCLQNVRESQMEWTPGNPVFSTKWKKTSWKNSIRISIGCRWYRKSLWGFESERDSNIATLVHFSKSQLIVNLSLTLVLPGLIFRQLIPPGHYRDIFPIVQMPLWAIYPFLKEYFVSGSELDKAWSGSIRWILQESMHLMNVNIPESHEFCLIITGT